VTESLCKGAVAPGKVSKRYLLLQEELLRLFAETLEDTGWMIGGPDGRCSTEITLNYSNYQNEELGISRPSVVDRTKAGEHCPLERYRRLRADLAPL
jgi:hypothetical protein